MEKLSEPEKCFLCLKVRKQIGDFENCENHGNGKGSSNSSWNPFSAKVIGRYFKIPLLEESPNSIDSDRFSLCEKCGKVWNTLSELIQLNEIIEMKISYWLEVMEKVLVGANRMENKTENFGEEETNSHILPLRLRKTILSKCKIGFLFLLITSPKIILFLQEATFTFPFVLQVLLTEQKASSSVNPKLN